eukprot:1693027-Karenia_brevis.AAC.1
MTLDASQRRLLRSVALLPRESTEGPRQYMHRANEFVIQVFADDAVPFDSGVNCWSIGSSLLQ